MKILIADDHLLVREGLKQILRELKNIKTIEEATEGNEALKKINSIKYDFIILDISMPGLSGLDILQLLKRRNKKENILILSVHPEEQYAIRALQLGASGFITKSSAYEELAIAINKISAGEKYISSSIVEKLAFNFNDKNLTNIHDQLSEREFQIMCMLAKGLSMREIGEKILISEKTVGTHRSRLLKKMGMKKNAELSLYAIKNNLIE